MWPGSPCQSVARGLGGPPVGRFRVGCEQREWKSVPALWKWVRRERRGRWGQTWKWIYRGAWTGCSELRD